MSLFVIKSSKNNWVVSFHRSTHTPLLYQWLPVMHQGILCNADVNLLISNIKPTPALAKLRPDLKEMSEKVWSYCILFCNFLVYEILIKFVNLKTNLSFQSHVFSNLH